MYHAHTHNLGNFVSILLIVVFVTLPSWVECTRYYQIDYIISLVFYLLYIFHNDPRYH